MVNRKNIRVELSYEELTTLLHGVEQARDDLISDEDGDVDEYLAGIELKLIGAKSKLDPERYKREINSEAGDRTIQKLGADNKRKR